MDDRIIIVSTPNGKDSWIDEYIKLDQIYYDLLMYVQVTAKVIFKKTPKNKSHLPEYL